MYYTEKTVKELIQLAYENGYYDHSNENSDVYYNGIPAIPSPEYDLVGAEIKKGKDLKVGDVVTFVNEIKISKDIVNKHTTDENIGNLTFKVLRPISKDELVKAIMPNLHIERNSMRQSECIADSIITLLNKGQ